VLRGSVSNIYRPIRRRRRLTPAAGAGAGGGRRCTGDRGRTNEGAGAELTGQQVGLWRMRIVSGLAITCGRRNRSYARWFRITAQDSLCWRLILDLLPLGAFCPPHNLETARNPLNTCLPSSICQTHHGDFRFSNRTHVAGGTFPQSNCSWNFFLDEFGALLARLNCGRVCRESTRVFPSHPRSC